MARLFYDIEGAEPYHHGRAGPDGVGVHAPDARTLVVRLCQPAAYFLSVAAHPVARAVPRHAVEALGAGRSEAERIVSSGPFCLLSWQEERMELVRDPSYHRPMSGNVERVLLEFATPGGSVDNLAPLYEAGSLDVLIIPDERRLQRFVERHVDDLFMSSAYTVAFVLFNLEQPPFSDARVRRAFVLASNREALVREVGRSHAMPALGGLVPPGIPGHSPDIGLAFDPDRARALLAEAGFPGGAEFPTISIMGPAGGWMESVAPWFCAQWQALLSVPVQFQPLGWEEFMHVRIGGAMPPLLFGGWRADYPDPHSFLHDGWLGFQDTWSDRYYMSLVERARQLRDQRERLRLYREADRYLVENAFVLPIYYPFWTGTFVRPWVKHYPMSALLGLCWQDVIVEPH